MISQMRVSFTARWVQAARNELFYTLQLSLVKEKAFLLCHAYATPAFFSIIIVVEKCSWTRKKTVLSAGHCCAGGVAGVHRDDNLLWSCAVPNCAFMRCR